MTTEAMLADMRKNLIRGDAQLEQRLQLNRWVYQPGIPENVVVPQSTAFAAVEREAKAWAAGSRPLSAVPWRSWTTQERQHFLASVPAKLTRAQLADLESGLRLANEGNSEVRFDWLQLGIKNRYDPIKAQAEQFLLSQGRRKFVLPTFRNLMAEGDWGRPFAQALYERARPGYHPVTYTSVDAVVRPKAG
jgi:hypothetical protein